MKRKRVRFEEPGDSDSEDDEQQSQVPSKKAKNSNVYPLGVIKRMRCCTNMCIKHICKTTAKEARQMYMEKNLKRQTKWIKKYLVEHRQEGQGGKFFYGFFVGVRQTCRRAWMMVHGVTKSKFYLIKSSLEDGETGVLQKNYHKKGVRTEKSNKAVVWLRKFASEFGDQMPDDDKTHLPSSMTRNDVYDRYVTDMEDMKESPCSKATFFVYWRKDCSRIVIPAENRFAKCDECCRLKRAIMSESNKEKRKKLQTERDIHLQAQNAERQKYYHHIMKAKTHPQKYMSIIIDGMDQQKTAIPRQLVVTKSGSNVWHLQTHVIGVIVHGRGNHLFVDMGEIPGDSNGTMNVFLQTLNKYVESGLPNVCYVQMDNCARENKNKYFFALCCLLVELNVFQKIRVSFLPVGHTHEDIDQLFSRIAVHLRRFSIPTFTKLIHLLQGAVTKICTTAERFLNYFNIRDWLAPFISEVHDHCKPHAFRFTKNEQGRARMQYKMWAATDEDWKECVVTGEHSYLLLEHPGNTPDRVQPNTTNLRLDTVLADVTKLTKKGQLEGSHLQEWKELIKQLREEEDDGGDHGGGFPLYDILPYEEAKVDDIDEEEEEESPIEETELVVHLGPKPRKEYKVPLSTDKMVCFFNEVHPTTWPQIGKILNIMEDSVTIQWYTGGVDDVLRPIRKSSEVMPKSCILTKPFMLTQKKTLPKKIKRAVNKEFPNYFQIL
ncbi:uncharacterized protein [Amphiura filiformis]|uniref:uncharacterized protein n=1 Tax=Amphiura filiformis TaxID=82378 RepID=UPI003B20B61B